MRMIVRACILILVALSASNAFRILGLFPFEAKSHWSMVSPLMQELVKRGHKVDVVSPFGIEQPTENYTDIRIKGNNPLNEKGMPIDSIDGLVGIGSIIALAKGGNDVCQQLKEQPLRDFIKNTPKDAYDIVVAEMFSANCYLAFGHHFGAPTVGVSSRMLFPWLSDAMGNIDNPSYIPNSMLPLTANMTYWQRFENTVTYHLTKAIFNFYTRAQNDILTEVFGPGVPGVRELERSTDVFLVNSHYSFNGARPLTPGVVEVAGLHFQNNDGELPEDLEKWMKKSEAGVVYFSLGTTVKSETFSPEIIANFYASFKKLAPVRVLWKANKEELPGKLPKNVLTIEWAPQRLILYHNHTKAFITHGGLMSVQESMFAGIPIIGIPLFGDQAMNVRNCEARKLGVFVDRKQLTQDTLDKALKTVLEDPTYQLNARNASILFRERTVSPLDTAAWWVEYMGRHGKGSVRSPSLDLTWWQVELLDIYGLAILAIISTLVALTVLIEKIRASLGNKSQNVTKKKKKQ